MHCLDLFGSLLLTFLILLDNIIIYIIEPAIISNRNKLWERDHMPWKNGCKGRKSFNSFSNRKHCLLCWFGWKRESKCVRRWQTTRNSKILIYKKKLLTIYPFLSLFFFSQITRYTPFFFKVKHKSLFNCYWKCNQCPCWIEFSSISNWKVGIDCNVSIDSILQIRNPFTQTIKYEIIKYLFSTLLPVFCCCCFFCRYRIVVQDSVQILGQCWAHERRAQKTSPDQEEIANRFIFHIVIQF